jgi:hypothetical protein
MRAPWIADRSYEACSSMWDTTVGFVRDAFGDLEHYRELSYEELRADPGEALRPVFEWLGAASDEEVLETIRVLSRQQFSDLGAVPTAQRGAGRSLRPTAIAAIARDVLRRGRERLGSSEETDDGESAIAFTFVRGLRERNGEALRSLTGSTFEFELSSPEETLALRGDEARDALARLADETFGRRYFREWWVATDGLSDWWASAPGKPFTSIFLSALGGNARRVDLAVCLAVEDELIRRVVVISAGPLSGRPVLARDGAVAGRPAGGS